jgi:hypothetical protein
MIGISSFEGAMCLQGVIEHIADYEDDLTIYAVPEWTPHSNAMLALEPASGGLPAQAKDAGMTCFLEVCVTKSYLNPSRSSIPSQGPVESSTTRKTTRDLINPPDAFLA